MSYISSALCQFLSKRYHTQKMRVSDLAREYHVSRPTIYKILHRGREKDFSIHRSTNARFGCLKYGIRRLAKIEKTIEEKLKRFINYYNGVKPDASLEGMTPHEKLIEYFFLEKL